MADIERELLPFVNEIPTYSGNVFYQFVKDNVGVVEGQVLEVQRIKNVRILLQAPDVFSFLKINCKEISTLKDEAGFTSDNHEYFVRPGIRSNMEQFVQFARKHYG